ncbi:MAG TPA: hypothetical protein VGN72_18425 [Tepidisphaeraceae bacterium]|jgi:hypothetical protein|nr:hypothetical protein [Tepidisphaeraceae bacterium]
MAALQLAGVVFGTIVLTAIALAGIIVAMDRPDWWAPFTVATGVIVVAAVLSIVPIVLTLGRGPAASAIAHVIATGVRVVVSLGGCFLIVKMRGLPLTPTLLLMVPYYLTVLAAESTMLALFIRRESSSKRV